jgi:hypothetical protein
MKRCNVLVLLLANAPTLLLAANVCEQELRSTPSPTQQYYMILAGQTDVFYDRSGPTFVMLQRTAADETDVGAFGIYAGERKQPVFGPVPASVYERFVSETRKPSASTSSTIVLRLEITKPQYERTLQVLQTWERRVRENALLYPDVAMDNILLVKQATEEINRCSETLVPYDLDWGLEDSISERNVASRIPYEYFRELARLNAARRVPDINTIEE